MPNTTIQNSLAAGELSPSLFGRTDIAKYHSGASTCRNFFVDYRGGIKSRGGLAYVGTCKQTGNNPPRDIPFQFSITQGYVLEFGDSYMRVKYQGAYVTETAVSVSTVSSAALFTTSTNHGYSVGDWVYNTGDTGFSGLTWIIHTVPAANTFTVTDLFGNVISSATASGAGGTVSRIYTAAAPYSAVDLPYLKYTQSADTMTLTCVNTETNIEYPSYELVRHSNTNWTFTADSFAATITAPTGLTSKVESSSNPNTWYSYVVTAVDATTGEESPASAAVYMQNNDIAVYQGSNTISWNMVSGAGSYNIYKATPSYGAQLGYSSLYGYAGTSLGSSFTDSNITADFTRVPPVHTNPFGRGQVSDVVMTSTGDGNYSQSTVGYSVSTSTGSGLAGTPVVDINGKVVDFIISNPGVNYKTGDTISITDSGGGRATGNFLFTANPANSNGIGINGLTLGFAASSPGARQIAIQGSLALTLQATAQFLNSSTELSWAGAEYSSDATHLYIKYRTPGTTGNNFAMTAGSAPATPSGATLTGGGTAGTGAAAILTIGAQTGTYPSVCAYFQQRRAYASTLNDPDKYWMSQPGLFSNMDSSVPVTDADALSGTPWSQQVNGIQWLVPMPGGLVVLTGKGAWQVNGGNSVAITPANQNATPQAYNGCNNLVPPITINYDILYVQSKGSIVRDLSYNFFVNIYTGTDLTVLSNHLFNGYTLTQSAWCEEPYKLVWYLRDDGTLLCLSYLKEQEVYAWTRHDTNGQFVSICSITEPPVDALYVITKRYVQGGWRYYSERMDNRTWNAVEDSFCADSALTNTLTYPNAILTPAAAKGTNNISSTLQISGGSGYSASPTITAVDSTGVGTGATFTATVSGGVITAITPVLQGSGYTPGATTLTITDSTGSGAIFQPVITNNVVFTASVSVFTAGNVGDVIRVDGGKATITTYTSGTQVTANITEELTNVIPDDPNNTPIPAQSGYWSISTPVTTLSGLNHLEGLEVCILADGSVVPNATVAGGSITLPSAASKIVIGLPYTCQVQTMYLDHPEANTIQNKRKLINSVGLRVEMSRGLTVGVDQPDASTQQNFQNIPWSDMNEIKDRTAMNAYAGSAVPLYTGDWFKNISSGWAIEGQVAVEQSYPLPASILALIIYFNVGDNA